MREYLVVFLVAGVVSYLLCVFAREAAIRSGAVARVRDRDVHATPIPYFGGVAMLGGLVLAIEIVVHHTVNASDDPVIQAFGMRFDAASPLIWGLAAALMIVGYLLARRTWAYVARAWDDALTAAREKGIAA